MNTQFDIQGKGSTVEAPTQNKIHVDHISIILTMECRHSVAIVKDLLALMRSNDKYAVYRAKEAILEQLCGEHDEDDDEEQLEQTHAAARATIGLCLSQAYLAASDNEVMKEKELFGLLELVYQLVKCQYMHGCSDVLALLQECAHELKYLVQKLLLETSNEFRGVKYQFARVLNALLKVILRDHQIASRLGVSIEEFIETPTVFMSIGLFDILKVLSETQNDKMAKRAEIALNLISLLKYYYNTAQICTLLSYNLFKSDYGTTQLSSDECDDLVYRVYIVLIKETVSPDISSTSHIVEMSKFLINIDDTLLRTYWLLVTEAIIQSKDISKISIAELILALQEGASLSLIAGDLFRGDKGKGNFGYTIELWLQVLKNDAKSLGPQRKDAVKSLYFGLISDDFLENYPDLIEAFKELLK